MPEARGIRWRRIVSDRLGTRLPLLEICNKKPADAFALRALKYDPEEPINQ